jgi:acetyltransferase-like isoleucine patch superfamily enzyme
MSTPAMTPQQSMMTGRSGFALYRELAVGADASVLAFLYYEWCQCCLAGLGGAAGFGLRALCYPPLFKSCGKRPAFGRNVLVRNPSRISIGKKALIDDYAVLDVRGNDASIALGDYVSVGRFTTLAAKGGTLTFGNGVNIGSYCRIATQSKVIIGESVLVAAYAYIGPGNHQQGDDETPLIAREMEIRGGVTIGANAWIGARATILDGVTIGEGAIIGAHSLVKDDVPAGCTAVGIPAKIVKGK